MSETKLNPRQNLRIFFFEQNIFSDKNIFSTNNSGILSRTEVGLGLNFVAVVFRMQSFNFQGDPPQTPIAVALSKVSISHRNTLYRSTRDFPYRSESTGICLWYTLVIHPALSIIIDATIKVTSNK